jgi:putative CocE/NonD family hydrolase
MACIFFVARYKMQKDFYNCDEWATQQPWSNGKIGLNGISYHAINQWQVASPQPPHLAAICIWEGAAGFYHDFTRHGGILCTMTGNWFPRQVKSVQYGLGKRGYRSRVVADLRLGANRREFGKDVYAHPLIS